MAQDLYDNESELNEYDNGYGIETIESLDMDGSSELAEVITKEWAEDDPFLKQELDYENAELGEIPDVYPQNDLTFNVDIIQTRDSKEWLEDHEEELPVYPEDEQPIVEEPVLTTKWAHGETTVHTKTESLQRNPAPKGKSFKAEAKELFWMFVALIIFLVICAFITAWVNTTF